MSESKPFFLTQNTGFTTADVSAEFLHSASTTVVADESASETQYFGFSVPAERIHALAYLWHRPKLKIITGGLVVWQGIKPAAQFAELFDWRAFMNDGALRNDLHDYRLPNGYGVKVLDPLKRLHMTYDDPARANAVDLVYEALVAPVMYADGNHFEQPMSVRGRLRLRGREYPVNCFNVRDRSWGKPRQEQNVPCAPMSWMTGVFNRDFAFNCCMLDQATGNPELRGSAFDLPDDRALNAGWLYRDGKVGRLVRAFKRVQRARHTLAPEKVEVEAYDEFDRPLKLQGTMIASNGVFPIWPHAYQHHPLMRWESDGLVTHGDCQEGMWNDYLHYLQSRAGPTA